MNKRLIYTRFFGQMKFLKIFLDITKLVDFLDNQEIIICNLTREKNVELNETRKYFIVT